MKSIKFIIPILLVAIFVTACSSECKHEYSNWRVITKATCSQDGLKKGTCDHCGKTESQSIPAAGHAFGEWMNNGDYSYRACGSCGYREFQYGNNSGQGQTPSGTPIAPVLSSYPNFDTFLFDCTKLKDNEIAYSGSKNTFEVNLSDGTYQCDGYIIHIPSRVTDVTFSGASAGTPFQNVKIIIDDRGSNINITFKNIMIESNTTILESQTRNINVNLIFEGSVCSLSVGKAGDGKTGAKKPSITEGAGRGGNGENGAPAIFINGQCYADCFASSVTIKGGDGGNGGTGGSGNIDSVLWADGGNGGNGGNGANAFAGDHLAKVSIYEGSDASFLGGTGGNGGKGGSSKGWGEKGDTGKRGTDGSSGCEIFYK